MNQMVLHIDNAQIDTKKKPFFYSLHFISLPLRAPPLSPSSPSLYFSISIALWVLYIPQKQLCRVIKRATIKQ